MQAEHISIVLRTRSHWEAVDLGFALVRKQAGAICRLWLGLCLPLMLATYVGVLLMLTTNDSNSEYAAIFAILLVWWLKPLYDIILLNFFSQMLFDEPPSLRQMYRVLPHLLRQGHLWLHLTFLRSNLSRSFVFPVMQLEGQSLRDSYKRLKILYRHTADQQRSVPAAGLTLLCLLLESMIMLTLSMLLYWLIPVPYAPPIFEFLFDPSSITGENDGLYWLNIVHDLFYMFSVAVMESCYVAAGFMLYLNRRTHLEGWDIELVFRGMAKRLAQP